MAESKSKTATVATDTTAELEVDPTLSTLSNFSSYAKVDVPETNPPSGDLVEQTLGKATTGPVKRFGDK